MRLGTKITLGYGLISAILFLSMLVHGYTRHVFYEDSAETRNIANEIDDIDTLAISVLQLLMPANDYLISGNRNELKKYESLYTETLRQLESLRDEFGQDRKVFQRLEENVAEIHQLAQKIFSLNVLRYNVSEGSSLMYQMDRVGSKTYELIREQDTLYHLRLEELEKISRRNIKILNLITILSWTLLIGLGIIIMYMFNHDIKVPIEKLNSGFRGVSHGRWGHVELNQNDELGDLAREFNSMVERLGSSYEDLENEVRNRTHELNELNKRLEEIAITDGLTNIYNYRYFHKRFEDEFNRTVRYSRPLSIILLDIDHFKMFNDNYGHQVGDTALQIVANILKTESRKTDIVARYGGEEFVIISPELDANSSFQFAEKLRIKIEQSLLFTSENQPIEPLTVSIGVAAYPEVDLNSENLLRMADKALYKAKSQGRNHVVLYTEA